MSIYLIFFIVLSYLFWIKCIYYRHRRTLMKSLKHVMNVLSSGETDGSDIRAVIVTAHPDDECMFFAPTIVRLVELNASVHLLCLSEGNYYNQGTQRKQELLNSCAVLGIPASRVTIVDHKYGMKGATLRQWFPYNFLVQLSKKMIDTGWTKLKVLLNTAKLPDDPKAEWSISLISALIVKHIRAHSLNMVLTFDGRGVSGHANHVAIHKAVSHLASTGQVPNDCCLLSLVTVGLLRKYISFLELPLSWLLFSSLCCIIGSQGYRQAKAAMLCHRTQLLWFRYLYITFSRYMFINTFQIIPQGPKNLKIY